MYDVTDGLCCFSNLSFISEDLQILMTLLLPGAASGPDRNAARRPVDRRDVNGIWVGGLAH